MTISIFSSVLLALVILSVGIGIGYFWGIGCKAPDNDDGY